MRDGEAVKTIIVVIIAASLATLALAPLTGSAGIFPSESIQTEGGFLLENDHIAGDNNQINQTQHPTSTQANTTMAIFNLNNVTVDDNDSVAGIEATRVTKNFMTPDGDTFMMEITADRMEIDGPDNDGVYDMKLWASEFYSQSIIAGGAINLECWTTTPGSEAALGVAPGDLTVDLSNAQFKAHRMEGQDVSMSNFELDMRDDTTRYTVDTQTNASSPFGCQINL